MQKVAICLGSSGWASGVIEMLDLLLADFLVSNHSQTELYPNSVSSFVWLCAEYGQNPTLMAEKTKSVLEQYLGSYFDTVVVDTSYQDVSDTDLSGYTLKMYINVSKDGVSYDTSQLFQLKEGKFKSVIGASNAT